MLKLLIRRWWWKLTTNDCGYPLSIVLTYRCNMVCNYCPNVLLKAQDIGYTSLYNWKRFITHYPIPIEFISITGGEPTLVPYLAEFINWLTEQKHNVMLYTNLIDTVNMIGLNPKRLRIIATKHRKGDKTFERNYAELSKRLFIEVREFDRQEVKGSKLVVKRPLVHFKQTNIIRVAPDLTMHLSCYDRIKHSTEEGTKRITF